MTDQTAKTHIDKSGFALQMAVEHAISQSHDHHGWTVVASEVPWSNGFVDLVLTKHRQRMVIECKKVQNGHWYFLTTESRPMVKRVRLEWWNGRAPEVDVLRAMHHHDTVFCDNFLIEPVTNESEYCVVPKGQSSVKELETVARNLLSAVHDLAADTSIARDEDVEAYIPVIVTTAQLAVCDVDPTNVDLTTGAIGDAPVTPVKAIRFRKSFVAHRSNTFQDEPLPLGKWKGDRERTVFIVTADGFVEFLKSVRNLQHTPHTGFPPFYTDPDSLRKYL